ncbi:MAG: inositol monophosphatase family protein [Acidimicrobiales bacterium]
MTDPSIPPTGAFGPTSPGDDPLIAELAGVALTAAEGAAAILSAQFGRTRTQVDTKSSATDMVSEVDHAAEARVVAVLSERRPDDGLLGEEGGARPSRTGIRWVIDPLDGTTNYLFGIPSFSVSLAAEIDGEAAVGVVIDPCRGETWAAARHRGAWCNGEPCRVASGRSTLETALVATGFGYRAERRAWQATVAARVLPLVRDIRRFGSAALDLCWVAGGRVDAYYEWGLNPWDLAAGTVICREAGATVEILPGRTILAGVPDLMGPLHDLLGAVGAFEVPDGPEPRHW